MLLLYNIFAGVSSLYLVLLTRIELVFLLYQSSVLPFNYRSKLAGLAGIEPTTFVSKTKMISISPKTDGTPGQIRTVTILLLRETPHTNWATGVLYCLISRQTFYYAMQILIYILAHYFYEHEQNVFLWCSIDTYRVFLPQMNQFFLNY